LALHPDPVTCEKLVRAYLNRVDPMVKVFHCPSLVRCLLHGEPYLDYSATDIVLDVIKAAVFLITIVSLDGNQCRSLFISERPDLLNKYRLACEISFERVGLINTEDIAVLQAFVLYLVCDTQSYGHEINKLVAFYKML
jgi:hypothetical protein